MINEGYILLPDRAGTKCVCYDLKKGCKMTYQIVCIYAYCNSMSYNRCNLYKKSTLCLLSSEYLNNRHNIFYIYFLCNFNNHIYNPCKNCFVNISVNVRARDPLTR